MISRDMKPKPPTQRVGKMRNILTARARCSERLQLDVKTTEAILITCTSSSSLFSYTFNALYDDDANLRIEKRSILGQFHALLLLSCELPQIEC